MFTMTNMKLIVICVNKIHTINKLLNIMYHIFWFWRGQYKILWYRIACHINWPWTATQFQFAWYCSSSSSSSSTPSLNTVFFDSKYRGRYLRDTHPYRAVCGSVYQTLVACTQLNTVLGKSAGLLVGQLGGNAFAVSTFSERSVHHCPCPFSRD